MSRDTNPFNTPPFMAPPEIAINAFGELRSVTNNMLTLGASREQIIQGLATALVCALLERAQELRGDEGRIPMKLEDLHLAGHEAVNAIGDRLGISVPT